jgi:hypothetical protein
MLALIAVLIYAPLWILGGLSKKRRRPAERGMRVWPLIAVLSLIAMVVLFMLASDELISRMGNFTAWSAAFFLLSLVYGLASLAAAVAVWRAPKQEVRAGVRWFSWAVSLPLFIAANYLTYWGMLGLRPRA